VKVLIVHIIRHFEDPSVADDITLDLQKDSPALVQSLLSTRERLSLFHTYRKERNKVSSVVNQYIYLLCGRDQYQPHLQICMKIIKGLWNRLGVYRTLPIFFIFGAGIELFMIKVRIGKETFCESKKIAQRFSIDDMASSWKQN